MVSADGNGSPVTPEGSGNPESGSPEKPGKGVLRHSPPAQEKQGQAGPAAPASASETATTPRADESGSATATATETSSDTAPASDVERTVVNQPGDKKQKKPRKPSRRQRRIHKLVMEFQPDAVEMEHRKVAGGLRWTLYVVILLLIATIAWAWWAEVDRVVMAEGKLIPVARTIVISSAQTSPIRTFEVGFGDTVKAGQKLVTLDPTFSEADVNKLETRDNALLAETTRLAAEQQQTEFDISGHENDPVWVNQQILYLDRQRQRNSIVEEYQAEIRKLEAQKERNKAEVKTREDLVEHREESVRQSTELYERNAGPLDQVRNDQMELKYARSNLITAQLTVTETEAEFEVLKRQHESVIAQDKAAVSLELAQKRQEHAEVLEDLIKARRANELVVIYAPDDHAEYKVVELADRTSVVQPGQPIMKLIPTDTPLELEVKVNSKDIALIRDSRDGKPKEVRIKISAFPYMKHGTLNGYIKTINQDITEEGQPGMSRAFYYVRVRFDDSPDAPRLRDVPDGNDRLRPGMSATAEIKVGRRRVIDYFIYPLFRSLDTSIREP